MTGWIRTVSGGLVVALLCVATPGPDVTADEGSDSRATEIIARMDDSRKRLKAFRVTIEMSDDIVQAWGQKVEFGETRELTVQRPNRLRLDVTDRDGSTWYLPTYQHGQVVHTVVNPPH